MPLHLIKLCVGCNSIADLEEWIEEKPHSHRRLRRTYEQTHTTRMVPKRVDELLAADPSIGSSAARSPAVRRSSISGPSPTQDGIGRCHLVLEPVVVPVEPRPFRPFQGWRYLGARTRLATSGTARATLAEMPEEMRRELADLGLI